MLRRFDGKVVVVTASTAGIGLGTAKRFAHEGARVVVSSRKQDSVSSVTEALRSEGLDVEGCVCHVGKADDRRRVIDLATKNGNKIDVLVLNAGVNPVAGGILDIPEWAIDHILDLNVKAAILLVREAAPHLAEGASIIFVSSIAGLSPDAMPMLPMYAVSKTALLGLTKALARELGQRGIRVNCVAPGIIPTKLSSALVENESTNKGFIEMTSLGRLGTVDEVAGAVAFLASQDAKYVTGETLVVAGGTRSRL